MMLRHMSSRGLRLNNSNVPAITSEVTQSEPRPLQSKLKSKLCGCLCRDFGCRFPCIENLTANKSNLPAPSSVVVENNQFGCLPPNVNSARYCQSGGIHSRNINRHGYGGQFPTNLRPRRPRSSQIFTPAKWSLRGCLFRLPSNRQRLWRMDSFHFRQPAPRVSAHSDRWQFSSRSRLREK